MSPLDCRGDICYIGGAKQNGAKLAKHIQAEPAGAVEQKNCCLSQQRDDSTDMVSEKWHFGEDILLLAAAAVSGSGERTSTEQWICGSNTVQS